MVSHEILTKNMSILYISNLHYDVTERELESAFGNIVPIKEVYIFYKTDGSSTGTAEIVLNSNNDALILENKIKNTSFKGRIIRVMSAYDRDTFTLNSLLVDNLPYDVTSRKLKEHFRPPLRVTKASVLYNKDGSSTGMGIVEFHKYFILDKQWDRFEQREIEGSNMKFIRLSYTGWISAKSHMKYKRLLHIYITNLHHDVNAEDLEAYFGRWLEVVEATIFYKEDGTSTGTGEITFYNFESVDRILSFVRKAFEDRIRAVWCPYFDLTEYDKCENISSFDNAYEYLDEDIISNFDNIDEEVEDYEDDYFDEEIESYYYPIYNEYEYDVDKYYHEEVQSSFAQAEVAGKQWKKLNDSEGVGRRSRMDEILLMKQFNKGGSNERLLKLKHYNSFAHQRFRERSYFVAVRIGIPECEFHCAIYVTNLHYDVREEELRDCFSAELSVKRTYILSNRDGVSTGTGMVVFKSRRDRLSCLLLFENKELKGRRIEMMCVPGLTDRCWDHI